MVKLYKYFSNYIFLSLIVFSFLLASCNQKKQIETNIKEQKGEHTGKSTKDAIVLCEQTDYANVKSEYEYLEKKFGKRGIDWELRMQSLIIDDTGKYDRMDIKLSNRKKITLYFQLTNPYSNDTNPINRTSSP